MINITSLNRNPTLPTEWDKKRWVPDFKETHLRCWENREKYLKVIFLSQTGKLRRFGENHPGSDLANSYNLSPS